jgi:hypothetical protein
MANMRIPDVGATAALKLVFEQCLAGGEASLNEPLGEAIGLPAYRSSTGDALAPGWGRLMIFRSVCVLSFAMLGVAAHGAECPLDHASYVEPVSGATLQFYPKGQDADALTVGLFMVQLPGVTNSIGGSITWNVGSNTRPDGNVGEVWYGNLYSLNDGAVDLVGDADMVAPKGLLLADFGRAMAEFDSFVTANPQRGAFDVFNFTGCAP